MDDNKKNKEEIKSYIDILKEAHQEHPNLILPSMGIIDNEQKLNIEVKDCFIQNNNQ